MADDEVQRDEDGFPIPSEALEGDLFRDEFEVVWVCQWSDDFDRWVWLSIGRL